MRSVWILFFGSWIFATGVAKAEEGGGSGGANPFIREGADDPAAEAQHLSALRRLTYAGEKNGEGYFSADGKRIVFQGVREPELKNPFYQIYSMDLATGSVRRISTGQGRTTCSYLHPDKQRILFASSHLDPDAAKHQAEEIEKLKTNPPKRYAWDFDPKLDIFETDYDGKNALRLTDAEGYDAECAYAPDGSRIVFCSFRDGDGEIYTMDADGKNQTRLTNTKGYDGGPFFSPDGKKIVWRRFTLDEKDAEVWIMDADGKNQTQVTTIGAMAWAPYWHPSMQWIVFACNHEDPAFEVYAIRPDGKDLTRLTFNSGFDGLPVFSPDGAKLMWTSTRDHDGSHLYIADVALPGIEAKEKPAPKAHEGIKAKDLEARVKELKEAKDVVAYLCKAFKDAGLKPAKKSKDDKGRQPDFKRLIEGRVSVAGELASEEQASMNCIFLSRYEGNSDQSTWDRGSLAVFLEILKSMSDVSMFRGLKCAVNAEFEIDERLQKLVAAVQQRDASVSTYEKDLAMNDGKVWPIVLGTFGADDLSIVIRARNGSDQWRKLLETLASANSRQRLYFVDEKQEDEVKLGWKDTSSAMFDLLSLLKPPVPVFQVGGAGETKPDKDAPVDYEALAAKANVALGAVYRLATGDAKVTYSVYDRAAANARKRPYLGTRPEYKGDGSGVVLQSVYPHSPAETAGVKAGDKVTGFAGKKVTDAESFLAALEACTPGAETEIEVLRGGETLKLKITPEAR